MNDFVNEIKKALTDSMEEVTTVDNNMEKALRPEVTREQLYAIVEALHEVIEAIIEVPEEDEMESESEDGADQSEPVDTPEGAQAVGDPMKNEVNWPVAKSEDYQSDNEDEDKWDNIQKSCWNGYKQEGMKEKNGRMVPNCVPVEKTMKKSLWSGIFSK